MSLDADVNQPTNQPTNSITTALLTHGSICSPHRVELGIDVVLFGRVAVHLARLRSQRHLAGACQRVICTWRVFSLRLL